MRGTGIVELCFAMYRGGKKERSKISACHNEYWMYERPGNDEQSVETAKDSAEKMLGDCREWKSRRQQRKQRHDSDFLLELKRRSGNQEVLSSREGTSHAPAQHARSGQSIGPLSFMLNEFLTRTKFTTEINSMR